MKTSKFTSARPAPNFVQGWQLFRCRKAMWQMIREVFHGTYRMSFLTTAVVLLTLVYIIFPFDLIPDYIPLLGWIDDGIILYLGLRRLVVETKRYNRFKAMERKS